MVEKQFLFWILVGFSSGLINTQKQVEICNWIVIETHTDTELKYKQFTNSWEWDKKNETTLKFNFYFD